MAIRSRRQSCGDTIMIDNKWLTTEQRDASILPLVVEKDGETVEVTVCDTISGGERERGGMPRRLSLIRWRDGVELRANYILVRPVPTETDYVVSQSSSPPLPVPDDAIASTTSDAE